MYTTRMISTVSDGSETQAPKVYHASTFERMEMHMMRRMLNVSLKQTKSSANQKTGWKPSVLVRLSEKKITVVLALGNNGRQLGFGSVGVLRGMG